MTEPSGPAWCARFPTSVSTDDLVSPFREGVAAFIAALRDAGASVMVTATYRPPERAALMHWSFQIGRAHQDPEYVPPIPGVDIDWTHQGDLGAAVAAAEAMIAAYGIVYAPALQSRHTQRLAIDMSISWQRGTISVRAANGVIMQCNGLNTPRNGSNPSIISVGRSYNVIKLISDIPHWSSDGR